MIFTELALEKWADKTYPASKGGPLQWAKGSSPNHMKCKLGTEQEGHLF